MLKKKIVLLVSDDLKRRLDEKKSLGYSINGYIRSVLEQALKSPRRRRAA